MCSSPGGKAIFAYRAFKPELLLCNEIIKKRITTLIGNLHRCKCESSYVWCSDPSVYARKFKETFDFIICDANPLDDIRVLADPSRFSHVIQGGQVVLPLGDGARPGDDRAHRPVGQHPGGGELGQGHALGLGVDRAEPDRIDQAGFAAALRQELAREAERAGRRPLASIFFGGGTPSLMAPETESLNTRLIETTRLLGARLMTVDENLAKVAKIQGLDVLNIHDLDDALKPAVAVGERIRIALVRSGKEDHQAVGYLPDGTMIVTNHAVSKMGSTVDVIVVSTLQTASGTMVFAELYKPA